MVDGSGEITKEYDYDAFGNETESTQNGVMGSAETNDTNPFRYAGEYLDLSSGTYYLRNRNYSPTTGRFLTEDPAKSGLNWYTYCENNPILFVDPSGLDSFILYDPNAVSGDGKHKFYDEAEIYKKQLEEQYGTATHLISVESAKKFMEEWNNRVGFDSNSNSVNIDEVVIILHGLVTEVNNKGYGYMDFQEGSRITTSPLITKEEDVQIKDLDTKSIGVINFSSCNTGNPDVVNVGSEFIKYMVTDKIIAWDGGTIFNYETNVLEAGAYGGWIKEIVRQPTYYKFVDKNWGIVPARKRQGEVILTPPRWEVSK